MYNWKTWWFIQDRSSSHTSWVSYFAAPVVLGICDNHLLKLWWRSLKAQDPHGFPIKVEKLRISGPSTLTSRNNWGITTSISPGEGGDKNVDIQIFLQISAAPSKPRMSPCWDLTRARAHQKPPKSPPWKRKQPELGIRWISKIWVKTPNTVHYSLGSKN